MEALASVPNEPVSTVGAEVEGNPDSPAVILTYLDFQAALCAEFAVQTLPAIENVYVRTGRVRLAVKPFPLRVHSFAFAAARNAACAARQGKFWRVHDYLFHNQQSLANQDPRQWPLSLGLDRDGLTTCLTEPAIDDDIHASIRTGEELGLSMIPTYFIGRSAGRDAVVVSDALAGSVSFGRFKTALDKLVKE
jgi:protein-disulfide isomerase